METNSKNTPVAISMPSNESKAKAREDRFFDRCLASIPKNSTIISARGVFSKGHRYVSYTYNHAGRTFTTTLETEGATV